MPGPARALSLLRSADGRHYVRARLRAAARAGFARRRRGGRERVAIALIEHLGDLVAAEPVARLVRRRHPDARISWVVLPRYADLVATRPEVDEVVRVGCLTEWIRYPAARAFDRVYDLHVDGRYCDRCGIRLHRAAAPAGVREDNYYHHGNLLRVFCLSAGLPPVDETPRLAIPAAAVREVDALRLPERFVVFHATTSQEIRTWPAAHWRRLAADAAAELPVVEIGLSPVLAPALPGAIDATGLSVLGTAEAIRRAALFVGGDSGPAHLANAVGTRGVLLLGRFGEFRDYVPWSGDYGAGRRVEVVRTDGPIAALPPERARAAVLRAIRSGREVLP